VRLFLCTKLNKPLCIILYIYSILKPLINFILDLHAIASMND
jgi:hypothetical protein